MKQKGGETTSPTPSAPSAKIPTQPSQAPEQTDVVAKYPEELVGLWRAERAHQYNPATDSFVPHSITLDNYFEFRADGKMCDEWVQVEGGLKPNKCTRYERYIVQGDTISVPDNPNARNAHLKLRIINSNQLELTIETVMENKWRPFIRYALDKVGP